MKKADMVRFYPGSLNLKKVWDSRFVIQNRYLPMLMINQTRCSNPLCLYDSDNDRWGNTKIIRNFYPHGNGYNERIRSRRTGSSYWIFSGYYSVIGIKNQSRKNINYVVNSTSIPIKNKYSANYDILVLGVVDRNYLRKQNLSSANFFVFDRKKITLLVSDKVWKNGSYCKQTYSTTLRKYIINFIKSSEYQGMTIKVVPHDYLNHFIDSEGVKLKTNSLLKVKEIEHEVKDAFFSNLNIQQFE